MLENTWTVIRVGINANNRHTSSFHVRALMSTCEAKAHAIAKLKADWANHHTDYLLDCINRGDFTVSHTAGA
jgi:tartrate dehydratase alpha subunit/fumarate hydratase class I-like protein